MALFSYYHAKTTSSRRIAKYFSKCFFAFVIQRGKGSAAANEEVKCSHADERRPLLRDAMWASVFYW